MPPKGQRIGYVRVSSYDQNEGRQLEHMHDLDRVFTDKTSGKDTIRPQLQELLQYVREGDMVVIHSMDRLARNLDDLRQIVNRLTQRGICVQFIKEGLSFTGEDSPMSHLMLSILGSVAQFERELLRERQQEGIALAKKRGVYKGRKKALSDEDVAALKERIGKESKASLARAYNISRETLYRYLSNTGK